MSFTLDPRIIEKNVRTAIEEDVGINDYTAQLIHAEQQAEATIICREPAIICGIPWVEACFKQIAPNANIEWLVSEGDEVLANHLLCKITGNARQILSAERCALNFLQTLSATATVTKKYVDAIQGTHARIMDTRKTLPGLRIAQKYAVSVGGGLNQRLGLYDGILIKENHIAAAGSIQAVLNEANTIAAGTNLSVQIEVENLHELETALQAGAKLILLDNFDIPSLKKAVEINQKRAVLEASGGIDLNNVREIALTGIDRISIGSLTKNIEAIDLSMRFANI
ncbi:MAG: carboxylating nicotinate-nucleotide diphosphorylase [Methylophilaceae bacterium]|nr:carboxylating nicotinate-nucleotide diphosphorylase [Methylophilaceae bacterium]